MRAVKLFVMIGLLSVVALYGLGGVLSGPPDSPKILMVVTSHGQFEETNEPTGLWLEEFAVPYRIFREAGFDVTVASPAGGKIPVDPRSLTGDTVLQNVAEAMAVLKDSVVLKTVPLVGYKAVFFPGGHGTMFDFPNNADVQKAVEYFALKNRPAAFVCHGPAALVGAKSDHGEPLVKGRRVAAFTDSEEQAVGLTDAVPFLLQSRLEELGATVVTAENFEAHVVVDGMLVTGQNPASSRETAQQLLKLIKQEGTL